MLRVNNKAQNIIVPLESEILAKSTTYSTTGKKYIPPPKVHE